MDTAISIDAGLDSKKRKGELEDLAKNNINALPLRKRLHIQQNAQSSSNYSTQQLTSPNHGTTPTHTKPSLEQASGKTLEPSSPIDIESISDDEQEKQTHNLSPNLTNRPQNTIKLDHKIPLPPRKASKTVEVNVAEKNIHITDSSSEDESSTPKPTAQTDKPKPPVNLSALQHISPLLKQTPPPIKPNKRRIADSESESDSEDDEDFDDSDDGGVVTGSKVLYCFCRRPDQGKFMIACDACDEWFHGECVNITQEKASKIKKYLCRDCIKKEKRVVTQTTVTTVKKTITENGLKHATNAASSPLLSSPSLSSSPMLGNKKCLYHGCNNFAKVGSKYCCDDCGMKNAMEMMKQKERLEVNNKIGDLLANAKQLTGADADDVKSLEELEKKKKTVQDALTNAMQQMKDLDKAVDFASSLYLKPSSPTMTQGMDNDSDLAAPNEEEKSRSSSLETLDCVTCGHPIPSKAYARHLESCLRKMTGNSVRSTQKEAQLLCGCPTTEFPSGYCERAKRSCVKHVNWERLRKAHLEQEKLRQENHLDSIIAEEKVIQNRITRRTSIQAEEANKTIVEA